MQGEENSKETELCLRLVRGVKRQDCERESESQNSRGERGRGSTESLVGSVRALGSGTSGLEI